MRRLLPLASGRLLVWPAGSAPSARACRRGLRLPRSGSAVLVFRLLVVCRSGPSLRWFCWLGPARSAPRPALVVAALASAFPRLRFCV